MVEGNVLVIGQGETGKPMADLLRRVYDVVTKDVEPIRLKDPVAVMHICYPFNLTDFVRTTTSYISEYKPKITIVHSTVTPGTTRTISDLSGSLVAYSPIRGKHTNMQEDLRSYTKYISAIRKDALDLAIGHLQGAGIHTSSFSSPEALELAKLQETTYFGLLIAWAQEIERFCAQLDVNYDEVMLFNQEISYLPPAVFRPGFIGGHCVMPNISLLEEIRHSQFLDAIKKSNEDKAIEWRSKGKEFNERLAPKISRPR